MRSPDLTDILTGMEEYTPDPMLVALLHRTIESLILPPLEVAAEKAKQATAPSTEIRGFEYSDDEYPSSTPDSERSGVLYASSEAECPEPPRNCECSSHRRQKRKTPLEELCALMVKSITSV